MCNTAKTHEEFHIYVADTSVAEASASYSLSRHSSPPVSHQLGASVKDANNDGYQQFQETGLFEDTLVFHSPLVETQVETFNPNFELVENSSPVKNMTTGPICAYEQEVVLDSEDEEMHDSEVVTVAKGLWDKKTDQTVISPLIKFQKRQLEPTSPSKQADERAANTSATSFGKSVTGYNEASADVESSDDKHHLHLSTTLNQVPFPQTEELSQANALGYIDHYLSFNNVELSQGICHRKATREKSPPVRSARGAQNLAKKIQVRTHHEEERPFEWVDSGQNDRGAGIFCKKIEASSNFGVCGRTYVRRQKRSGYTDNCSTGNRCDEKLAQGPGTVVVNNNSIKVMDVQSDEATENVDAYSGVTRTQDMSGIGLDTQLAAEAMEALACVPSPESRCTKIKDQSITCRKRNNNVVEGGTVRYKRKRNGLVADPFKLVHEPKYLRLPSSSFGVARKCRLNCQVQVSPQLSTSSRFLRLDSWHYPKGPRGKRKCHNAQSHPDAPINLCTQSMTVNGKESDTDSTRSPRVLEGQVEVNLSCFPHTNPLYNAKCIDTGITSEGRKVSNADVSCYKHHKKPCNKNVPKSSLLKELIRLGVSESTPDLTGKDLRQRRDMSYVRVLFSQHLDESIIKQQKKILARMNISVASCSMEATHFVADKFTRTQNMLETMALGKLVVTHLWLESCREANCIIDEKNYILRDMKKEKDLGFSMPVSLARAKQRPLLKGRRVFITPRIKPDNKVITSLVTAVHGRVVDECQIYAGKNDKILDDLLILSCEEDYAVCHPFLERGIAVYGSELLLSGIVTQKLELERYQLFANSVARNNPTTSSRRFGKVYRRRRDLYLEHS